MDDEHGAFWVSVITDNENIIEVNKDLSLSVTFERVEMKYQVKTWTGVELLCSLLLLEKFEEIKVKIN